MEKLDVDEDEYREPIPGEYGNPIPRELFFRELGFANRLSRFNVGNRAVSTTLATKAVHTLATKENFNRRKFKLPHGARTTFHMAFSPDGTKVASCHGDHNIYVCDVRSGEVLQTLTGHPRTPWCVVFHPTQNDVLASGCLAGHIRVWDLNGGSEVLVTDSGTVIASLAFHPTVRLLVIATFNEIMFWDWNLPYPLARCSTENPKEKVRLVRFDRLGKSLITGITNYPHPPTREGLSNTAGANHRPNILTRNNAGPSGNIQDYVGGRSSDVPTREAAGAGQARSNRQTGSTHAGAGMASLAASLAVAAEAEAASSVLNRRQDRFQESYRQLVNHYQDLVTHYQQFLRSRIPRLLETSRLVRDQPGAPPSSEPPIAPVPNPEMTQPLENFSELPGPRRLAQIERRLQEIMNNPEVSASLERSRASASSAPNAAGNSTAVPGPSRLRNDSDLRNIEMLAQNILEMQNLCSQARRDAPLTIETQHIIELQNIRRHLEMLQEQTRDLQSSIRATLTSLARNSLDALRSQVDAPNPAPSALNPGRGRLNLDMLRGPGSSQTGPSNSQAPLYYPNNAGSSTNAGTTAGENGSTNTAANPSNAILRITIGPRLSASAEIIPPSTSASTSNSANNNRSQPSSGATTMHYEIPIPVTSRQSSNSNPGGDRGPLNLRRLGVNNGEPPMRRVTHEYYIGTRREHLMEQHARNCPFNSRDQMVRPPPRLRCLSEMGQTLNLTVWPTMDSDNSQDNSQISDVSSNRRRNNIRENSTTAILPVRSQENSVLTSISTLVVPHQVFAGRLNWISNDIGVHMQLLMRQLASRNRSTTGESGPSTDEDRENWQRCFMGGYALVPQSSRRGERPEVDLQRVSAIGSTIPAVNRPNSRITYREDGTVVLNLRNPPVSTSASTSSPINTQTVTSGDVPITSAQMLPSQLPGGFSTVYRMRIGDEIIPVFTSPENAAASFSTHILEGPLPNVFVLPIGLFLRGVSWENNTESVGIYWPPLTRDEEENLISISNRTGELVRVYAAPFRNTHLQESENQIARHRVTYDNNQLRISVSDGTFITFEQPGLLLLDLISSVNVLPRPRPLHGVVYVNYVSSVLFAVERLFANRPTSASFYAAGTSNGHPSGYSAARMARNPYRSPQPLSRSWIGSHPMSNADSGSRAPDSPSAAFSFTLAEPRIHLERVDQMLLDRRRRIVQAINEENANRANSSAMNVNGATAGPSTRYRLQSASAASGNIPAVSESVPTDGRASPGPRRIIRLAVDAATGEIRREPPYTRSSVDLTRAIESRIERVLNERGNRGIDINSSSFLNGANQNSLAGGPERGTNGLDEEARERQVRLEDIQLRICMLAQWPSRQVSSVSSATQTVGSNEGEASNSSSRRDMSTNTTAPTTTEPRPSTSSGTGLTREGYARSTTTFLRRRTLPEDNVTDEYGPSQSRRPRLDRPVRSEDNSLQVPINGSNFSSGNSYDGHGSSVPTNMAPNDTYLSRLRSALRSHWERNARHLTRPYGNPAEHGSHGQPRTESRLPSQIPTTDLNRSYSNSTAAQSNSTHTSTVQSNQMPRVAIPPVFSSMPQSITSESTTRSQTTPMTSGEPVLFQLPDFFAPLEVSRVENSPEASGSSRDFENGRLQESHLILEPSLDIVSQPQADRRTISSPVYETDTRPEFGSDINAGLPADIDQVAESRSELPYQRLRQALASANSVLERIGEAAVRETISALNSENNIAGVPGPLDEISVPTVPSFPETPESSYLRDPRLPFSPPPPPVLDTDVSTMGLSAIDEATARNAANAVGDFLHLQEAPEPQVVLPLIDPIDASLEIDPSELVRIPSSVLGEAMRPINPEAPPVAEPGIRAGRQPSRSVSEWYLRRRAPMTQARIRVTFRSGNSHDMNPSAASSELSGSARTRIGINVSSASASNARPPTSSPASTASEGRESYYRRRPQYGPENISPYLRFVHNYAGSAGGTEDGLPPEAGARYYPGYIPEILISPRARSQTYYTMDAATTAFLSSRIQKWDFSEFCIPDITDRTFGLITSSCSLLSDSTLDVSSDSEFIAVLQPSDNGSYSAVGIYSLRDETLGDSLYTYHFDQNTVSVSISPSCDYIVVGYAGRGAFYRIIHPSRHIGQILSLTRDGPQLKLIPVKDLYADTQPALMSVNCMQWVPVPGYGIVYGTNTGEVVLLS